MLFKYFISSIAWLFVSILGSDLVNRSDATWSNFVLAGILLGILFAVCFAWTLNGGLRSGIFQAFMMIVSTSFICPIDPISSITFISSAGASLLLACYIIGLKP